MELRLVAKTLVDKDLFAQALAIDSKATVPEVFSGFGLDKEVYLDHIFLTFAIAGYAAPLTARPASMRSRLYPRRGVWILTGSLSELREFVSSSLIERTQDDLNTELAREIYNSLMNSEFKGAFARVSRKEHRDGFYLERK